MKNKIYLESYKREPDDIWSAQTKKSLIIITIITILMIIIDKVVDTIIGLTII